MDIENGDVADKVEKYILHQAAELLAELGKRKYREEVEELFLPPQRHSFRGR